MKSASGFSLISFRSLFSPILKYAAASSMESVYRSQNGILSAKINHLHRLHVFWVALLSLEIDTSIFVAIFGILLRKPQFKPPD